jgi:hypothetical protein
VLVADVKTGQSEPKFPHGATTQIAIYSRGHIYKPDAGRTAHLPTIGVDQKVGLMIHLPQGTGECRLYLLDLTVGWSLARTAVAVQDTYKAKPLSLFTP